MVQEFFLGAVSPFFLYYGTVIPEPKGLQVFLMLLVVVCLLRKQHLVTVTLLPAVLGLAISYYGLGIVFVPLALWKVMREANDRVLDVSVFTAVLCLTTLMWLLPFDGYFAIAVLERLHEARLLTQPNHANIWRVVQAWYPEHWRMLRLLAICAYVVLLSIGAMRRVVSGVSLACAAIFVYVCVIIAGGMGGAMDRANVGVMMGIVGIGLGDLWLGWCLACTYCALGTLRLAFEKEVLQQLQAWGVSGAKDAAFVDGICVLIMVVLTFLTLAKICVCDRHKE